MRRGFTLIELLVVISIIGILIGLSVFGLQGAREGSRDARRKADLELIRSALEIYKSDCNVYPLPTSDNKVSSPLKGDGSYPSCAVANTYLQTAPTDPDASRFYRYNRSSITTYELCSSLENGTGSQTCGTSNCGVTCNYKVTNP